VYFDEEYEIPSKLQDRKHNRKEYQHVMSVKLGFMGLIELLTSHFPPFVLFLRFHVDTDTAVLIFLSY